MPLVLKNIENIFETEQDRGSALFSMLQLLGEEFECQWVAFYRVDFDKKILQSEAVWKSPTLAALRLEADALKRKFSIAEGMPGRTWRQKNLLSSSDLSKDMMLLRSFGAEEAGLKGGLWFPVLRNKSVIAVVEMLKNKSTTESFQLFEVLNQLGDKLGDYIE